MHCSFPLHQIETLSRINSNQTDDAICILLVKLDMLILINHTLASQQICVYFKSPLSPLSSRRPHKYGAGSADTPHCAVCGGPGARLLSSLGPAVFSVSTPLRSGTAPQPSIQVCSLWLCYYQYCLFLLNNTPFEFPAILYRLCSALYTCVKPDIGYSFFFYSSGFSFCSPTEVPCLFEGRCRHWTTYTNVI